MRLIGALCASALLALGVVAAFVVTSERRWPPPNVTIVRHPHPTQTVTTHPHHRHHHEPPVRPAPTNPAVPVTPSTVTRTEHPPTRSTTITRTQPAPPPSTRTVTRPPPTHRPTNPPNVLRSVVCDLGLCPS